MADAGTLASYFYAMAFGQALLSASLLFSRSRDRQVYLPLALFFIALSVSEVSSILGAPALQMIPRSLLHFSTAASFPTDLILLPLFLFYVRALTAEREPYWSKRDLIHLIPALVGLCVFIVLLFTPIADKVALFETGRDHGSPLQSVLFLLIVGLYVTWLCQWLFYALVILKRLVAYRVRLKDLFATTNHLELGWISWLGLLILIDWLWVAIIFVIEVFTDVTPFEEPWLSMLDLVLIWTVSVWGLRQKPGLSAEVSATEKIKNTGPRYENSALSSAEVERLAGKIEASMQEDRLYRNPELSLSILAKHIGAKPNYVSQTLNSRLGFTFFDYVNKWRVKDAQIQLENSTDTVLAIAHVVGFNTRSSFYAAFKRYVGSTPSAWRKRQKPTETVTE